MNKNINCIFCKIVKKEIDSYCIYENELSMVFLDNSSLSNAHCLLITKKHFKNITEIDAENWINILFSLKEAVKKINLIFRPKGFSFISNMNEISYQSIFHFHLHIIPKYQSSFGFIFNSLIDKDNELNIKDVYKKLT